MCVCMCRQQVVQPFKSACVIHTRSMEYFSLYYKLNISASDITNVAQRKMQTSALRPAPHNNKVNRCSTILHLFLCLLNLNIGCNSFKCLYVYFRILAFLVCTFSFGARHFSGRIIFISLIWNGHQNFGENLIKIFDFSLANSQNAFRFEYLHVNSLESFIHSKHCTLTQNVATRCNV